MRIAIRFLIVFTLAASALSASAQPRIEENVVIGMVSGLALVMDVHYPSNPNGYAIVHISGSGYGRPLAYNAPLLSKGQVDIWGQPLVEAGYTVFSLNHRAIPRFRWPDPLHDVQRAVRYIRTHAEVYGIDPERIGAVGGSSGGALVTALGVFDGSGYLDDPDPVNRVSAKVQTVVARAPLVDMNRSTLETEALLVGAWLDTNVQSIEYRKRYEASPINYATADDAPMLFISGDKDTVVPIEHSERMRDSLRSVGVEARLLVIPGAGHGPAFPGAENPPDYIAEMVKWFDHYLKR